LDEQIDRLVNDDAMSYVLTAVFGVTLAALEWFRWATGIPPAPKTLTVVALGLMAYCTRRLLRIRKTLRNLRLGRDGERVVGEYLDRMRTAETRVLHDILGDGFNVDHVLIAPQGIFAIETKTYSKPSRGEARIAVMEAGVSVDGRPADDKILRQAAAQRSWLRDLLKESTGRDWHVRSVVLFPGWFVERSPQSVTGDLWVLNPKALPKFLPNEPTILGPAEVQMATFHLSRYIRTK